MDFYEPIINRLKTKGCQLKAHFKDMPGIKDTMSPPKNGDCLVLSFSALAPNSVSLTA
jgi:hypothetical protein